MASGYEGHAAKRLRTNNDGYGVQSGKRDELEDPHKPSPSPVVHVRGLTENVTKGDLVDSIQKFGPISYVIMLSRKRQALVEFEDLNGSMALVDYVQNSPVYVGGRAANFNYSTSQKLDRQGEAEQPNCVLLFTILNPQYPITVDVMHTVCSTHGNVNRIVIFKKNGVQAMVEFDSIEAACRAKENLQGADIYSGCCTLQIQFAKPTRLNVVRNDSDSFDYTNPSLGKEGAPQQKAALLDTPQGYNGAGGGRPYGGPNERPRGPPGGGQDNYRMDMGYSHGPGPQGGGRYGGGDPYGPPARGGRQGGPPPADRYGGPQGNQYGSRQPVDHYGPPPPAAANVGPYDDYGQESVQAPGMLQEGAVMMVYGLPEQMNCERIFNLFCLYGNVVRIKFLRSKEGSAMVQMGDPGSVDRIMKNLNNLFFFQSKMQLGYSKQAFLQDVPNPHDLKDGSPSFKDFMGSRNNRFMNPEAAAKNRIQPPSKCLYYFNAPPKVTEEELKKVFEDAGVSTPSKIKQFPSKSEKSSTGLVEWDTKAEAVEALVCTNHAEMPNPGGKHSFVFRLCFAGAVISTGPGRRYNDQQ